MKQIRTLNRPHGRPRVRSGNFFIVKLGAVSEFNEVAKFGDVLPWHLSGEALTEGKGCQPS